VRNQPNNNTDYLWNILLGMLGSLVFLMVALLVYLPVRNDIDAYFNKPHYDKEKLARLADKRAALLRNDWDRVENGIHIKTGMVFDKNFKHIKSSCLSCHSSKMITQNRANRGGWLQMIRWMQETQNLPDLGEKEAPILDYLAEHYAPEDTGRRPNLDLASIEWYILELD